MKNIIHQSLIGILFGVTSASSFLFFSHTYSAATTGEPGVPANGYIYEILQNKLLVNGNMATTDGKVQNTDRLDYIPATGYQKPITGNCAFGEWAIGVNPDNSIKCRSN